MAINGVDISSYQPNWVPTNEEFVFVKATEGTTYTNPYHSKHIQLARAAGLVVGHYHFLHHGTPVSQAKFFVKQANVKAGDILVCDFEAAGCTNDDKNKFMAEVKELCPNNKVILYCNTSWWNHSDKKCMDGLWIAYPSATATKPPISEPWLFWQWSWKPIDKNRSTFSTKAKLKAWANDKPAPVIDPSPIPAPIPTVPTVDGIELGSYETSGTNIQWRPLYHNNNVKATGTCYCVTQAIAVAEAKLKKLGVIKVCLDFWQFGYGEASPDSANTHANGGVVDTVQTDNVTWRVLREVGFTASWYRGPGSKYGNFSTPHIHAVLSGCPHVSAGAKSQISSTFQGVLHDKNGLGSTLVGPDYAPASVKNAGYITWKDAFKKYVTQPATDAPVSVIEPEDNIDMATQEPVKHRSKPQVVAPTKSGHKILRVEDNGNVSWAFGPGRYEMIAYVRTSGSTPDEELLLQAAIVDTEQGTGKVLHSHYNCAVGLPGGGGTSFRQYVWRWNVGEPPKGSTRRLRLSAQNFSKSDITINEMYIYSWKAPI